MKPIVIGAEELLAAWRRVAPKVQHQPADDADLELALANPEGLCGLLAQQVASGVYRPQPLRPLSIPKDGGGHRTLLVPPLQDRVVQSALAWALSEALDGGFSDSSFAYRPGRGVQQAAQRLHALLAAQPEAWLVDADIFQCFDWIAHRPLVERLKALGVWEHMSAWLLRRALRSEMLPAAALGFDGQACLVRGVPQGSPLSPLLCNVMLDVLDKALEARGTAFVRFADDFVALAADERGAVDAREFIERTLAPLGLRLNPNKTRCAPVAQGFSFLGETFSAEQGNPLPSRRSSPKRANRRQTQQAPPVHRRRIPPTPRRCGTTASRRTSRCCAPCTCWSPTPASSAKATSSSCLPAASRR